MTDWPTVATLTWNTALCRQPDLGKLRRCWKRASLERPCAVRIHLYAILEKAGLWHQQTWLVLGLFEVSKFWWWTLLCSHCGDSYTYLYLLKLLEPYICMYTWVNFCVSIFFLFFKGRERSFFKTCLRPYNITPWGTSWVDQHLTLCTPNAGG